MLFLRVISLNPAAQLERAGQLTPLGAPETIQVKENAATVRLKLPRQAVSLLVLEGKRGQNK